MITQSFTERKKQERSHYAIHLHRPVSTTYEESTTACIRYESATRSIYTEILVMIARCYAGNSCCLEHQSETHMVRTVVAGRCPQPARIACARFATATQSEVLHSTHTFIWAYGLGLGLCGARAVMLCQFPLAPSIRCSPPADTVCAHLAFATQSEVLHPTEYAHRRHWANSVSMRSNSGCAVSVAVRTKFPIPAPQMRHTAIALYLTVNYIRTRYKLLCSLDSRTSA